MTAAGPEYGADLYSDDAICDPHYRAIRDLAPAVWLSAHGGSFAASLRP